METTKNIAFVPETKPLAIWSIFVQPLSTLGSLSQQPRWFLPLLLTAIYSTAINYYVTSRIGFVRLLAAVARSSGTIDPEAVIQSAMAHKTQIIVVQAVSAFLGGFVTPLFIALVLWLLVLSIGGDVIFKNVLAVAAHVALFTAVVKESMLAIAVTASNNLDTFNISNPLATNLGFFIHSNSPAASRILSSLDLITIINVLLIIVGLTKVSHKLSPTAACMIVIIPWSIYVAGSAWMA